MLFLRVPILLFKPTKIIKQISYTSCWISRDIEELNDVASQFPDIIKKVTAYAKRAHAPVRLGKVIDASLGFKRHSQN